MLALNGSRSKSEEPAKNPSPPPPVKKSSNKLVVVSAVVLVAGAVCFFAMKSIQKPKVAEVVKATPVMTVSVEPAALFPLQRTVQVNGSVSAWDPISVSASVSGLETKQVLVEEGDFVRKGQVLAVLDSSQLLPQLESERARLRADLGNLSKSMQPNRREDISAMEAAASQARATVQDHRAALTQAKANLDDARQNAKRYALLVSQGAVSAQDYDTRKTTEKVGEASVSGAQERIRAAQFSLRQAEEKLSMAKSGGRVEDIDIARANADQTKGSIRKLEAQLALTSIKAPVDGLVTKRDVHVGDVSTTGKTMFSMARDNRLELRAQVPEADLPLIKPMQEVAISSPISAAVLGHVREISPLIDSESRLATVRIDLPAGNALKPGSYAEGQIQAGRYPAMVVPASAVVAKDEGTFVLVLIGDHVERRSILPGSSSDNKIEVKSGLKAGELVVVKGAGFLKDRDVVTVGK